MFRSSRVQTPPRPPPAEEERVETSPPSPPDSPLVVHLTLHHDAEPAMGHLEARRLERFLEGLPGIRARFSHLRMSEISQLVMRMEKRESPPIALDEPVVEVGAAMENGEFEILRGKRHLENEAASDDIEEYASYSTTVHAVYRLKVRDLVEIEIESRKRAALIPLYSRFGARDFQTVVESSRLIVLHPYETLFPHLALFHDDCFLLVRRGCLRRDEDVLLTPGDCVRLSGEANRTPIPIVECEVILADLPPHRRLLSLSPSPPRRAPTESELELTESREEDDDEDARFWDDIETEGEFKVVRTIAKGQFGSITLVRDLESGSRYCVKRALRANSGEQAQALARESLVLYELTMVGRSHPFIVKLLASLRGRALLMEFVEGGTLAELLARRGKDFTLETRRYIYASMASALEFVHSRGILFRDLKPENVMVVDSGVVVDTETTMMPRLKLVDFGLAKSCGRAPGSRHHHPRTFTFCGTLEYLSPELLAGVGYSYEHDAWALGVLCYEVANGFTPFSTTTTEAEDDDSYEYHNYEGAEDLPTVKARLAKLRDQSHDGEEGRGVDLALCERILTRAPPLPEDWDVPAEIDFVVGLLSKDRRARTRLEEVVEDRRQATRLSLFNDFDWNKLLS